MTYWTLPLASAPRVSRAAEIFPAPHDDRADPGLGYPRRAAPGPVARLVGLIVAAEARWRNRVRLQQMDDRMRRDIGLPPRGLGLGAGRPPALEGFRWF